MIILGIDPGMKTGVAQYMDGKLVQLWTIEPWQFLRTIESVIPDFVVFEDSRKESHVWNTTASRAASIKMARNIGEVDAWCKLIEASCDFIHVECLGISPLAKGAKLDAAQFGRMTGWDKASNQHTRDAAMCAWPYRNKVWT